MTQWTIFYRIGEAKNPGPQRVGIVVLNPTSVFLRIPQFLSLQADILLLSETSATSTVQDISSHHLKRYGWKASWSLPVAIHACSYDQSTGKRGAATGTAIFTHFPLRTFHCDIDELWLTSSRIHAALTKIGHREILLVCLYGYPQCHVQSRINNDALLRQAYNIVSTYSVPAIVAGDINMLWEEIPSAELFFSPWIHRCCRMVIQKDRRIITHDL